MVKKNEIERVGPIWRDPEWNCVEKVGIQGLGSPRRDPGRNSAQNPGPDVPNGGMATHLATKRLDLGSLGLPAPARTPLGVWVLRNPTLQQPDVQSDEKFRGACWMGTGFLFNGLGVHSTHF